jgi:ketosteroid isomerase-like protein
MRTIVAPFAILLIGLAGCEAREGAEDDRAGAATDSAAIEANLKSIEAQWEKDYHAHDAEKLAGHYAPDAALANPGSALATDDVGRRLEIQKVTADRNSKISFSSDRVGVAKSGELAYTRGHYTDEKTDPRTGQVTTLSGSYLTVWKKQSDGSWKAIEDFVVPGPPPKSPTPTAGQ